ncbi:MAG TPA: hypothetical protein ENI93_07900 [Gammaproteobacteria bacterium]|nr:hypothetical protein [Gammaproteobacteria bacterium]
MKTRMTLYAALVLSGLGGQFAALGDSRPELADEIETPDALLRSTDEKERKEQYGDEDIYISSEGEKENAIITPDPLERSVGSGERPEGDIRLRLEPSLDESDKAIEHPDPLLKTPKARGDNKPKSGRPSKDKRDELETPDPLLDNMNQ